MVGLECKMTTSPTKNFPFSRMEADQITGLQTIVRKGGKGLIAINFRFLGGGNDKGKVYVLDIVEMLYLMHSLDRASIPIDYLENNTLHLPRLKLEQGYGWDLRHLY